MKTQLFIVMLILFTTTAFSQKMTNFSGIVRDSKTGKTLEDINVFINEKNTGTITDYSGSFFIFLTEGIYDVSFSGNGYKPEKISIDLRNDMISEMELTPASDPKKRSDGWLKKRHSSTPEIIAGNNNQKKLSE